MDLNLYNKFVKNCADYCFGKIPPVMIGTSITDSPC